MTNKTILIAAAIATMVSCAKNQVIEPAPSEGDSPIGFSAYTGTASTKGTSVEKDDVIDPAKGIGVFAFYQPAVSGTSSSFSSTKYPTPDFMYNANVKPDSTTPTEWTYSPVKYWPNNPGDQVSFFAYAPYVESTTWEDLGISTDVNATKLTASFPVYTEKAAMKDYLFATPALNRSKQRAIASGSSPDLITFNFKHIMSRIALQIGCVLDEPNYGPKAWADASTVITVESIAIKGIAESYDYVYTISGPAETWTSNGEQDLVLTAKAGDFRNNTSTDWTTAEWKPLLSQESSKDAYLFIAPQNLASATMEITYTVATTDTANPANSSTVTNVIEKPIGVDFKSGYAYTLNLLIGMKTVELSATVTDWTDGSTSRIDVPANS